MVNPENELKSVITEKLLQLDEVLSANPLNRTNLILTGGNAKTFARLYLQVSANLRPENSSTVEAKNWLSTNWAEFECTEQIFQSQSADEQIEQWKLHPQQTEVFNSALAVFRAIGRKLRTEQLCIPFFGLKESLLLSLVSVVTEKPMEDFTLVLIYGPPKKYKIGA
jgi:exopolyphosphatase/pppGpp-phosphohydrolase